MLNAVLFVLIGLEVLALDDNREVPALGYGRDPHGALRPAGLGGRTGDAAAAAARASRRYTIRVLTWGGLRGGISVALALSLPREAQRPAARRHAMSSSP